ncbi:hypothetical protein KBZ18_15420 [Synechococcus sp. Cruz-9H2]|uniref:hypothetical protein n=1 Tax=unclassified Synechococcus TaxID=2626047 RepID=UPI0020CC9DCF|nr:MULTISPECIES: hypothetical protein [unclassified Synechococcus]MCP9820874.1 hypothetical protein [Synechococcus sp. Cruz-9H2]MCP9845109.1 hypothetical protein [Synechococcus sp. Edmonson 11F2]MCP9857279.1 hypothetical protein [Synechococcus sp. Cruz-9C9]MCP9864525.1 hypothetical protein [Synechococcus sp. Cruz-7E5]MCP9871794.1 hypothetical protein [Synechococcus sp. Cruz-7B9]
MSHLAELETWGALQGLQLRLQVSGPAALRGLRVGVARRGPEGGPQLLGDLKGWAIPTPGGLHLDTLRIQVPRGEPAAAQVGPLIWAATFAWALEHTPCRHAALLAIRDDEHQHRRLVRYFRRLGFEPKRELGAGALDLPQRLLWGGAGLLMLGECAEGLRRCERRLGLRSV